MRRKPLFPPPKDPITGKKKRNKGPQDFTVLTINGRVRLWRRRWHSPGEGSTTPLDEWLRERGITTVSIAGYMTHMCCDTTARQAVHRGFKSEFLSDATGTLPLSNAGGTVTAEELQRYIYVIMWQCSIFNWFDRSIGCTV